MKTLCPHALEAVLSEQKVHGRIWLACSGGMDSCVLLDVACQSPAIRERLTIIHVNHQIQAQASAWENQIVQLAKQAGVPVQTHQVSVSETGNLEANAREARYAVFAKQLAAEDVLLTAHHERDQAETFLLRLTRGAGLTGLSSMPVSRPLGAGRLIRPLLKISFSEITAYAEHHKLIWSNDPSNQQLQFSRNFFRHELLPSWQARSSNIVKTLSRAAVHCGEQAALLSVLLSEKLASLLSEGQLDVSAWQQQEEPMRTQLLRQWIQNETDQSDGSGSIAQSVLAELSAQLYAAKGGGQIQVAGMTIGYYRQRASVLNIQPVAKALHTVWDLHDTASISLPDKSKYCATAVIGEGLSQQLLQNIAPRICYRSQAGQSYKKQFQALGIPPWARENTPLLLMNHELLMIGQHICYHHKYLAKPGEPGWLISYTKNH